MINFARERGIGTALVNSNEAKRKGDDSLEASEEARCGRRIHCTVSRGCGPQIGRRIRCARTTPHIYLFDSEFRLVYRGSIDDNVNSADEVKDPLPRERHHPHGGRKEDRPATTKAIGCSIKRVG